MDRAQKAEVEKNERKQFVLTSGGPTMEAEDVDSINKKFKQQQMLNKLNLSKQRDMEEMERSQIKKIMVTQEREDADRIAAKHLESKQIMQQQKVEQLAHMRAVWDAQKNLKQKTEEMENCF